MGDAAIVTLAVGEKHLAYWRRYCQPSVEAYARKQGYDLIVITEPLDRSDAAAGRSASWQKCLILGQEFAAKYRQVVLLDSDIAINVESAPRITEQAPVVMIGGVISGSHIHPDLRLVLLHRMTGQPLSYERGQVQWREYQGEYYKQFGLSPMDMGIVQAGVLVASPRYHRELFERVYQASWPAEQARTYEQVPLSHAILSSGMFRQIDTRFNSVFFETLLVHYPYLLLENLEIRDVVARCAVQAEFANNFFLHFAHKPEYAAYLPPAALGSNPG